MRNKIVLSCTNDEGMVSEISLDNFGTNVRFGFPEGSVKYLGRVDKNGLSRLLSLE